MSTYEKLPNAICYGDPMKFQTYEPKSGGQIQIRDRRPDKHRAPEERGVVAIFPTLGGGMTTYQSHDEAKKLARRIVKLLNGER